MRGPGHAAGAPRRPDTLWPQETGPAWRGAERLPSARPDGRRARPLSCGVPGLCPRVPGQASVQGALELRTRLPDPRLVTSLRLGPVCPCASSKAGQGVGRARGQARAPRPAGKDLGWGACGPWLSVVTGWRPAGVQWVTHAKSGGRQWERAPDAGRGVEPALRGARSQRRARAVPGPGLPLCGARIQTAPPARPAPWTPQPKLVPARSPGGPRWCLGSPSRGRVSPSGSRTPLASEDAGPGQTPQAHARPALPPWAGSLGTSEALSALDPEFHTVVLPREGPQQCGSPRGQRGPLMFVRKRPVARVAMWLPDCRAGLAMTQRFRRGFSSRRGAGSEPHLNNLAAWAACRY